MAVRRTLAAAALPLRIPLRPSTCRALSSSTGAAAWTTTDTPYNTSNSPSSSFFADKRVLITGSTSGIGAAIARKFAARGARIMLNGFANDDVINALQAELKSLGAPLVAHSPADLSLPQSATDLVTTHTPDALGGSVDILVNNAGIQYTSPVDSFPATEWDRIIAINLSAVFHASKAAIPFMAESGFGRIVNVASVHALVGSQHKAAYVAAKHGVMGFTKVCGLELAVKHKGALTCNAICPGWVRTELVERQIKARAREMGLDENDEENIALAAADILREKQPSGQFVRPEDLGEAVLFLASEAAAQMNGTNVVMDGGWTAQ